MRYRSSTSSTVAPGSSARGSVGDCSRGASSSSDDARGGSRFLCFEVLDTGVGVSRQALESLFRDYVQMNGGGMGSRLAAVCGIQAVLTGWWVGQAWHWSAGTSLTDRCPLLSAAQLD